MRQRQNFEKSSPIKTRSCTIEVNNVLSRPDLFYIFTIPSFEAFIAEKLRQWFN